MGEGVEVQCHSFLTCVLDETEWSLSHCANCMSWGKSLGDTFNRRLVAAHS